jgi:hypothetical protein
MSRLSDVLESGAEAALVRRGLWQAVVWQDTRPSQEGWRCWAVQPREADEDLDHGGRLWAPDLPALLGRLALYPYFLTPDLPWQPGKIPDRGEP